jgi:hypothetical protein
VGDGGALCVEGHQRRERLCQAGFAAALLGDLVFYGAKEAGQGHGRRDGCEPLDVVGGGVQETEFEKAGRGGGVLAVDTAFSQSARVQLGAGRAQLLDSMGMDLGGHVWLSSFGIQ